MCWKVLSSSRIILGQFSNSRFKWQCEWLLLICNVLSVFPSFVTLQGKWSLPCRHAGSDHQHQAGKGTGVTGQGACCVVLIVPLTTDPSRGGWMKDRQAGGAERAHSTYLASPPLLSLMPEWCLEQSGKNPSVPRYPECLRSPRWWLYQSLGLFRVSVGSKGNALEPAAQKGKDCQVLLSEILWINNCFSHSIKYGWESGRRTDIAVVSSAILTESMWSQLFFFFLININLLHKMFLREVSPTKTTSLYASLH